MHQAHLRSVSKTPYIECPTKNEPIQSSLLKPRASAHLEALPVNNRRSRLIILFLTDPHTLESRKRSQDRSTNPHRVLPLRGSHNLNLNRRRSQSRNLLRHTLTDSREHGGSSRKDNVGIKILTNIHITLHNGLERRVSNTIHLQSSKVGLEKNLRTTEALIPNNNNVTIRELEGLLKSRRLRSLLHLLLKVHGHKAEGLFDITDNLTFGRGGKGVSTLSEDFHEVVREVTSSQVETDNGMGESIPLVNGDSVGNTISRIEDTSRSTSGGIQTEHSLNIDVHGRHIKSLKHDLCHPLPVGLGVLGSLGKEDGVSLGSYAEFVVESVVPDFLHVVPVGDDSVLDGVF
mmetsp:Transcript_14800/g.31953  ORF Transcript_14800/g.31953 Transcript_14800/m.31953 type:complete len:346 (+) Transcript_14800:243-1280(+)